MNWLSADSSVASASAAIVSAAIALRAQRSAGRAEQRARDAEFRARLWPTASQVQRTVHRLAGEPLWGTERDERLTYLEQRAVAELGVHSPELAEKLQQVVLAIRKNVGKQAVDAASDAYDEELRRVFGTAPGTGG